MDSGFVEVELTGGELVAHGFEEFHGIGRGDEGLGGNHVGRPLVVKAGRVHGLGDAHAVVDPVGDHE